MGMIMGLIKYTMFVSVVMFVGYVVLRIMHGDLKEINHER